MVWIIEAYVEGLPISSSSNFLTRLASVYLEGGEVNDSSASTSFTIYLSFSFIFSNNEIICYS